MRQNRWAVFLYTSILFLSLTIVPQWQASASNSWGDSSPRLAGLGVVDPVEMEAYWDGAMAVQLQQWHAPGAVVVVVKDGEIFFAKGYGYADLEGRIPVAPDQTIFHVGSLSKLFTATAILQLWEQGRLDLNADVNNYLSAFQIPSTYEAPITIDGLLTHTSGLGDHFLGAATWDESDVIPLEAYLAQRLPGRLTPPGEGISYTNHGYALLGYLVEKISGVPFSQYIDENILEPLAMRHSGFVVSPAMQDDLAVGYEYRFETFVPMTFEYYFNVYPAGAMVATGTDMAHFMIAHLQDGQYQGQVILQPATVQEMHRQHYASDLRMPGWAYGFYEHVENGVRVLEHGGSWPGFSALMFLVPEDNLGVFIAYNAMPPEVYEGVIDPFIDHYYPRIPYSPQPMADYQARAQRYAGDYRYNRWYSPDGVEKLMSLVMQYHVIANADGTITIHYPGGMRSPTRWVEVQPLLFQRADGGEGFLAFREDADGRVTHLILRNLTPVTLPRLAWYESSRLQFIILGFVGVMFLTTSVLWPVENLWRWFKKLPASTALGHKARLLAGLISLINVVFLVMLGLLISKLNLWQLTYDIPVGLDALLLIPILTTLLSIGLPVFTILTWKHEVWTVGERLHYFLVTIATLLYVMFLYQWNLLGL